MSEETLLQIPVELIGSQTKSVTKTTKLQFETQETVPPELIARITAQMGKVGWLSFLVGETPLDSLDVVALPEIKVEKDRKSQAERLRAVIWRLWEKNGKVGDSEAFYNSKTEQIIEHLKKQLEWYEEDDLKSS